MTLGRMSARAGKGSGPGHGRRASWPARPTSSSCWSTPSRRTGLTAGAHRHLERQLADRPPAPGGGVDRLRPPRRALPPGDQAGRRRLPPRGLRRPRATRRPTTATGGGTGWPSSAGSGSTDVSTGLGSTDDDAGDPADRRRLRRGAGAVGLRPERARPRRRALPGQAGVAGPPAGPARRDRDPRPTGGGVRRLQRGPRGPRRVGPVAVRGDDPCEPARARRPGRPRVVGPGRRLPPAVPRRQALQLVGLPGRFVPPPPGHAHRPDPGHRGPGRGTRRSRSSTARPARARSPRTTPRSSSTPRSADAGPPGRRPSRSSAP